jgi:hypothetical protein
MEQLAEKRRAGDDVQGHGTWGAIVGKLPDLRELKLVLETFEPKQDELERVVKCAETWQFPIEDTPFTLVWDGKVEDASWTKEPKEANGNYTDTTSLDEDEGGSSSHVSSEEEGNDNGGDNSEEESEEENFDDEEYEEEESAEEEREEEGSPEHPSRYWNKLCSRFEVRVMRFVRR